MCGIAGIIDPGGFDPQTLVAMTHLISYRGPSGFGFAYSGRGESCPVEIIHDEDRLPRSSRPAIGLGNRRLAILDVSAAGNQPMSVENGAYSITYNGEIYNYREVRAELETLGHRFRTRTDTEVIIRAYQQWGQECLRRFNGMWGFALWDRAEQLLFCARDRFGVKPFYYALVGCRFYFASEIKQILEASCLPRVANPECVRDFLEWGLLDSSASTFFNGIRQLPPGHHLQLKLSASSRPIIARYWELCAIPELKISAEEAVEEFRMRFKSAVRLRLRSDVPVGVSLSGGLDSSAIACQVKDIAPDVRFHTFSACFQDKGIDEREYVAAVVAAIGSAEHFAFPQAEAFWSCIRQIAYHQDEPMLSTGTFPQWCVMEQASKSGIRVILGGQGGDETLCGYRKYRYFYLWHLLRSGDSKLFHEALLSARNGTAFHWATGSAVRYLPQVCQRPFSLMERLAAPEFRRSFPQRRARLGSSTSIGERQKTDLTFSSIPTLLHHEDRISMAHSVESRHPFLDYELVEFAVRCPPSVKLRNGWSKWLLRNALAGMLPEKIRLRKTKLGFDTPDAQWVRLGLENGHRALWQAPKLRMERFLNSQSLRTECKRFLRKDLLALSSDLLFRAISLELWAQVHSVS